MWLHYSGKRNVVMEVEVVVEFWVCGFSSALLSDIMRGFRCFLQPLQTNSGVVSAADETAAVVASHILTNSLFADHFFLPHCLVRTIERVFK